MGKDKDQTESRPTSGRLTPYQGMKRSFGKFACCDCERPWGSANSWANTAQQCCDCKMKSYPFKQFPLRQRYHNSFDPYANSYSGSVTSGNMFGGGSTSNSNNWPNHTANNNNYWMNGGMGYSQVQGYQGQNMWPNNGQVVMGNHWDQGYYYTSNNANWSPWLPGYTPGSVSNGWAQMHPKQDFYFGGSCTEKYAPGKIPLKKQLEKRQHRCDLCDRCKWLGYFCGMDDDKSDYKTKNNRI